MKEYVLSYYPIFKCVAEKCKHTCCAGWDLNIDDETLTKYKNHKSAFSNTLKNGINFRKSRFKSDKKGRCAFLNNNGLCEIIINLGEEGLCQVCLDHPRFRSFFESVTETGLGFCCERATEIILSSENKIEPILIRDDNENIEPTFIEKSILEFRAKAIFIIQNRTINLNDRIQSLLILCRANIRRRDFRKILKTFTSFERLDKSWNKRLKTLKKSGLSFITNEELSLYFEQFTVNSLYRHLWGSEDTISVRARTLAVIISWWIIKSIFENEKTNENVFFTVCDIVRSFSAEVEYSNENLNKLFNLCYKFIKL